MARDDGEGTTMTNPDGSGGPGGVATPTGEHVVLLSETGEVLGTAPKASVHTTDTPLHLAFSCYVVDDDGRLLLTRRALSKVTWPGVWTNACCGHPALGEDLPGAVLRRLEHELGLEAPIELSPLLPDFRYRAVMANGIVENEICPVFLARVRAGTPVSPDPSEVEDHRWVTPDEFRALIAAGDVEVSPWSVLQMRELDALGELGASQP
jgi:isopentenyl-diphosphate delta-isomerase